ncbi:glycosyl hydrolase [Mucilaginibacter agri]|uniref:Asl1-like glycosyl hydrolase catalytic domain-containing protein n=1 Tax=Mucilaginibacter agri TaxID=2695265 RepID=A0A965ZMG4_9SPHI|nr:glycosyl hydrolase [Mucilaginibacter agri]NCD72406.1 hypothetical protein [Mucilaginibacter agri]
MLVNKIRPGALFFLLLIASNFLFAQTGKIIWGANGHPLTQADFNRSTWKTQISYLKELNVDTYRIDVMLDSTGLAKKDDNFVEFLQLLKANGIASQVTAFPAKIHSSAPANYQDSFNQGVNFVKKYGEYLNVIEVGNEEDNASIQHAGVDGSKRSHYNTTKLENTITKIGAFIDGAKSVKPDLKVSLSFSWLHYGFLDVLEDHKVKYDIIGLHWYSNMGDPTNVKPPYGNYFNWISAKYHKPIWITEFNYFQGTTKADFQKQNQYVTQTLNNILQKGGVGAVFIYELFDQPALRLGNPTESNYGILYKDNNGEYAKKDVFDSYKQIISGSKENR